MRPFAFSRATTVADAARLGAVAGTRYLGGGTNLLDLMKEDVERPTALLDLSQVPLADIVALPTGGLRLGAGASNTATANHPLVRQHYPLLTQALLSAATEQIRNMATNGGNLLQRTRCPYFYDVAMPCNKRQPGTGCGALHGSNRTHALLGWSEACVAVHPSDMCVALAALDATVLAQDAAGTTRRIAFTDFHRLPGAQPALDNTLRLGELLVALELPASPFAGHCHYLKVRERTSYAFALVSVAAALALDGRGRIGQVRLALGGVAHKPWRATEAERLLVGRPPTADAFRQAARAALAAARPLSGNAYKIVLAEHAVARALEVALASGG